MTSSYSMLAMILNRPPPQAHCSMSLREHSFQSQRPVHGLALCLQGLFLESCVDPAPTSPPRPEPCCSAQISQPISLQSHDERQSSWTKSQTRGAAPLIERRRGVALRLRISSNYTLWRKAQRHTTQRLRSGFQVQKPMDTQHA